MLEKVRLGWSRSTAEALDLKCCDFAEFIINTNDSNNKNNSNNDQGTMKIVRVMIICK